MINYDVPTSMSIYIGINDRPNLYTGAAIMIFARICSAAAVVKTRFLRYHIFAPVNYKVEIIIYYKIIYAYQNRGRMIVAWPLKIIILFFEANAIQ